MALTARNTRLAALVIATAVAGSLAPGAVRELREAQRQSVDGLRDPRAAARRDRPGQPVHRVCVGRPALGHTPRRDPPHDRVAHRRRVVIRIRLGLGRDRRRGRRGTRADAGAVGRDRRRGRAQARPAGRLASFVRPSRRRPGPALVPSVNARSGPTPLGRYRFARDATVTARIGRDVDLLELELAPLARPLAQAGGGHRRRADVLEQNGKSTHSLRENIRVWSPEKGELGLVD